jgi:tRNA nucleotidyltransferase (CCA-adding enzyme)
MTKSAQVPNNSMPLNRYLVGGAVRDNLLKREVIDRDYVVVGTTIEHMLMLGFIQVGKDFPVFLHPQSKDEYALARTEKKYGQGYTGFVCFSSPEVTLEQDLKRRDLTVNAIAQDEKGHIIDPFNGVTDLNNKLLRHISPAFSEDPLRVLRVARFAARYHYLDFTVHPDTLLLMEKISQSGELQYLSIERVLKEMELSISEKSPWVFFDVLHQCSALEAIWPEIDKVWLSHGKYTLMQASRLSPKLAIRFAAIVISTHQTTTVKDVIKMLERLKTSNEIKQLTSKAIQHLHQCHRALTLSPKELLSLFDSVDAWRKPQLLTDLLMVCQAENNSRCLATGIDVDKPYIQASYLLTLAELLRAITAKPFIAQGIKGKAIKNAIVGARLEKIGQYKTSMGNT